MQIYILLTERCNLNCKMCIRGKKINGELSLEDIEKLSCFEDFSYHNIVLTGGEPTLCKDFIPIVSFFSKVAQSVSICTNGTNSFFVDTDILKDNIDVQISIDGTEKYHDAIRGRGTYKQAFKTILKLESLNLPYTISSVVNKDNVECMHYLADELKNLKSMKYWNISYEMPFGNASFSKMIAADEWNKFVDKMLDYVCFRMKIQKLFPFELIDKNKKKFEQLLKGRRCSNCGSVRNKIYIYPDLNVYPCTCLTDFKLGNLKEETLSNILKKDIAQVFANYTVRPESKCFTCKYLKYCNGGCIGMSYNYFKVIGLGDIRCPKLKI